MASISPICKKCKNFISALKSPNLYRLHDKKIIKIQDIKISHLGAKVWDFDLLDSWFMKKNLKLKISCQTPFKVIEIHNALPCSALAEAYGQKQKKSFWRSNKKLHFLYILKN